jgi:hypothetical protein
MDMRSVIRACSVNEHRGLWVRNSPRTFRSKQNWGKLYPIHIVVRIKDWTAQTRPISDHQQDAGSRVGEMTEGLGRIALRTGSQEAENRMYETV